MKSPEEAIERVLAGLRDSNASAGMERRILKALEDQLSERSRSGWRQFLPMWLAMPTRATSRYLACGVALAGLFAIALAVPAIRRLGHSPVQSRMHSAPAESRPLATAEVAAERTQPSPARTSVRAMGQTNARRAGAVRSSETAVAKPVRAASYPAPPMPLTEQERLLLRIAHKGDPEELAMLNSEVRTKKETEGKAEFQMFFGPSTVEQTTTRSNE